MSMQAAERLVRALLAARIPAEIVAGTGEVLVPRYRVLVSFGHPGGQGEATARLPNVGEVERVTIPDSTSLRWLLRLLRRQVELSEALRDAPEAGLPPTKAPPGPLLLPEPPSRRKSFPENLL